jgi:hypothetical protein
VTLYASASAGRYDSSDVDVVDSSFLPYRE